jgi:hypothetical protein
MEDELHYWACPCMEVGSDTSTIALQVMGGKKM